MRKEPGNMNAPKEEACALAYPDWLIAVEAIAAF